MAWLVGSIASGAGAASAPDACVIGRQAPAGGLSRIALRPVGFPAALADLPERAASMWNADSCNSGTFPRFIFDGASQRTLTVRWIDGAAPTAGICGRFARDVIELYAWTVDPADRRLRPCGDRPRLAEILAHELGHALGLFDVGSEACGDRIMSQLRRRADGSIAPRAVHADECAIADRRFETAAERLARFTFAPDSTIAGLQLATRGTDLFPAAASPLVQ